MSLKILSVFGTRPEAVKMAPVVHALAQTPGVEARVCVTAQHREMLDQVLDLFGIQPDIDLDLMRENQPLAELSAAIFTHLDPVLEKYKPDWVLVQGDTTTVAITALMAYYRRIRVGHVEAGLRTHDKWQPFPEEINRRVAGVTADLHFAPTEWSRQNLLREGVPDAAIAVTGNPVIDALQVVARQAEPEEVTRLLQKLSITCHDEEPRSGGEATPKEDVVSAREGIASSLPSVAPRNDTRKRLILVTAHRRENFGQPLENICAALKELAARGDVEIVYPVHLNPNVQEPVYRLLGDVPHVTLLPPLDYLPLVHLMKRSAIVLTDSGGIQEEAPAFGVPVLVLRAVTERPEGVEAGVLKLVGTANRLIVREANRLLDDPAAYACMARASNPFGDGHAAERIVQALLAYR
ncbi:MAG: UDP-N-acetylglucosamine 2-epimerase (non-hydrolyzing) [Anaerolineae bacterium CG_4_9_14_0_8_um_filter_58_9]|nr:MAG: UDP-N-acetylglucosamine 2-epimerase (non-hydrolyzing) [Anaerolineae bacterium CG_4_9_14_0_8_um_filter_58_9]